jgi:DNA-binding transcriptional MerR regulator
MQGAWDSIQTNNQKLDGENTTSLQIFFKSSSYRYFTYNYERIEIQKCLRKAYSAIAKNRKFCKVLSPETSKREKITIES